MAKKEEIIMEPTEEVVPETVEEAGQPKKMGFFNRLKRYWKVPKMRATQYVEEQRAKVHTKGPKEGTELTEYERGLRSGYLQCQSDHAGLYKYKKAIEEGKSKSEARAISQEKGTK